MAVAVDERLGLEHGPVLDGDGASQGGDALERPRADRLGMVEEPPGAVGEHPLGGELVEYCQEAVDRLAVARVQAKSPVVTRQDSDGLLGLVEGGGRQLGPGLAEVLEVHRRQRQHLAGAVEAQPLIPSPIRIVAAHWARSRSSLPAVCGSRW